MLVLGLGLEFVKSYLIEANAVRHRSSVREGQRWAGVEHGSIAPRRKWTELTIAEGFGISLPHFLRFP